MTVRCKAFVASIIGNAYNSYVEVNLNLVYSQTPETENFKFHSASPSGNLKLTFFPVSESDPNPAHEFTPGSFWYVETEKAAELGEESKEAYAWLSGIDRDNGYYVKDGKLVRVTGTNLRAKCKGRFNRMNFESDIYIANEHVHSEFAEIGTLYKLAFIPTTKEG